MIILLTAAFLGAAFFEILPLVRKKYWRELAVFSAFMLLAFVLSLLQTIGVKIPSPMRGIRYLIEDVLHLGYGH